ncbi:MAG TPA: hypothetical protein VFT22_34740 [Kofleriaceae bacterium]|nr:hypothetical protein [Kofleriaceae bacterium]
MKKSSSKESRPRKLVLRHEAIALLAPPQLSKIVAGTDPSGWPPHCISDQQIGD